MSLPKAGPRFRGADSRGQVLVIVAGGFVAILLAVGLVIDTGIGFITRRDAQNVSDLAAMAGTKLIADHYLADPTIDGPQVYAQVDATAQANGCTPASGCTWTGQYVKPDPANTHELVELGAVTAGGALPADAQGVTVRVGRSPAALFMRLIGHDTIDVSAAGSALAAQETQLPPGQVLPIAADPPNQDFTVGQTYELTAGMDGPGNFSWLSWTGSNDPNHLATSICTPNNPELTFPVWVDGDPGASNSNSVRACVDYWIANGATVLIPLWDQVQGQGNSFQYRIVGMAAFVLTARGQPAIDSIQGRFVAYYSLPSVTAGYGGAPDPDDANRVYFLGLVR